MEWLLLAENAAVSLYMLQKYVSASAETYWLMRRKSWWLQDNNNTPYKILEVRCAYSVWVVQWVFCSTLPGREHRDVRLLLRTHRQLSFYTCRET